MAVPHDLRLRSLADMPRSDRLHLWMSRLKRPAPMRPLRLLYHGVNWTQVDRLERAADLAGFNPEVLVASAGLGLRWVDSMAPAYAATFSDRHPDSVPGDVQEKRWWWQQLNETPESAPPLSALTGPILFVLSEQYSRVLAPEISRLSDRHDVLVVGGSRDVPEHMRLPADRGLRQTLGGTATSLNSRTAVAWLERLDGPSLVSADVRASWVSWAESARRTEVYNRQSLSDQGVMDFIRHLREGEPLMSKTRALRQLRDSGLACEQHRFGDLFGRQVGTR